MVRGVVGYLARLGSPWLGQASACPPQVYKLRPFGSLTGCASQGRARDEAIHNIKQAIEGFEASLRSRGLPVPSDDLGSSLVVV